MSNKFKNIIYIIIALFIVSYIVYMLSCSKNRYESNIHELKYKNDSLSIVVDSLYKITKYRTDSIKYRVEIKDSIRIKIHKVYDTIKVNIPNYSNDDLDSIIFMESRFSKML